MFFIRATELASATAWQISNKRGIVVKAPLLEEIESIIHVHVNYRNVNIQAVLHFYI